MKTQIEMLQPSLHDSGFYLVHSAFAERFGHAVNEFSSSWLDVYQLSKIVQVKVQ
jgi:hypothetical protein